MNMKSTKDVNDKLMKSLGFHRHPKFDDPAFNQCGNISYWINDLGIMVITSRDKREKPSNIVNKIIHNAAYQTRRRIRRKLDGIDFGEKGFIKDND